MKRRSIADLDPVEATEHGVLFATAEPVTFRYVRNTVPAPYFGDRFQQDIEPAGRYLLHSTSPSVARGWEAGEVHFRSPLVISLTSGAAIYGPGSWKARLQRHYGKVGRSLSTAIRRDGYDGIVTVDSPTSTSEIVDLTVLPPRRRRARR